jgi:SNF family Na+-dependent transporter
MPVTESHTRHSRVVFAVAGYTLLQSLLNPVPATLQHDLHTSQVATTWVITAYLLSASSAALCSLPRPC